MAKKKMSIERVIDELATLLKSKRGAIVALITAIVTVEAATPGTLAGILGEQWAVKLMPVLGILVAATKVIDNNKAE
jgi:hypothetical protein